MRVLRKIIVSHKLTTCYKPPIAYWSSKMIGVQESPCGDFRMGYMCSRCKGIYNKTPYCGGCGAKMLNYKGEI